MIRSFKEHKKLKEAKIVEGKAIELSKDITTLEVSKNIPENIKSIDKDEKKTYEEFKTLYKDQINNKCMEDYGTIEDEKLWEDIAKEMYLQSSNYIPSDDIKPEKIEESKEIKTEEENINNEDINSLIVIYTSNQTFTKYYNLSEPISKETLRDIRTKIINKEWYISDIVDKLNAKEVTSKKELNPNTSILRIKDDKEEIIENIDRSSKGEKKLLDLVQVVNSAYNLENVQMEKTPDGKAWHIITTDGKDIVTVNGLYWNEDELEDLRINGYIKEN